MSQRPTESPVRVVQVDASALFDLHGSVEGRVWLVFWADSCPLGKPRRSSVPRAVVAGDIAALCHPSRRCLTTQASWRHCGASWQSARATVLMNSHTTLPHLARKPVKMRRTTTARASSPVQPERPLSARTGRVSMSRATLGRVTHSMRSWPTPTTMSCCTHAGGSGWSTRSTRPTSWQ